MGVVESSWRVADLLGPVGEADGWLTLVAHLGFVFATRRENASRDLLVGI